jgi:hypothetical protein
MAMTVRSSSRQAGPKGNGFGKIKPNVLEHHISGAGDKGKNEHMFAESYPQAVEKMWITFFGKTVEK